MTELVKESYLENPLFQSFNLVYGTCPWNSQSNVTIKIGHKFFQPTFKILFFGWFFKFIMKFEVATKSNSLNAKLYSLCCNYFTLTEITDKNNNLYIVKTFTFSYLRFGTYLYQQYIVKVNNILLSKYV